MKHTLEVVAGALVGLSVIAFGCGSQADAQEAADAPPAAGEAADANAGTVLRKVAEHYKGLEHAAVTYDVTIEAGSPNGARTVTLPFELAFERPNRLRLAVASELIDGGMVSDGEKLHVWLAESGGQQVGRYVVRRAPSEPTGLLRLDETGMFAGPAAGADLAVLLALFDEDPHAALVKQGGAPAYVGREELDGEATERIMLTRDGLDVHMWVAADGTPWVRRIWPDIDKMNQEIAERSGRNRQPVQKIDMKSDFGAWSTEAPPPDTFAFVAPDGVQKSRSLVKLPAPMMMVGERVPDFELTTLDGETFRMAEHVGEDIVVLDFWATWCGPCKQGLPVVTRVTDAFRDQGVVFVAVDLAEDDAKVNTFMQKMGWTFTVGMDRDKSVGKLFKVSSIPQTVIIGKDGTIERVHVGLRPNMGRTLTEELETLLRGETLVPTEG